MDRMNDIYIFDLDGTLALIDHRRHFVEAPACPNCHGSRVDPMNTNACCVCTNGKDKKFKPDWTGFYKACVHDEPNPAVLRVFDNLLQIGNDIRIWSGRSDEVRDQTLDWLSRYTRLHVETLDTMVKMRPHDDFTADDKLKEKWFKSLTPLERSRIVAVFDDRDKVVNMWRRKGLTCLQVAPGEF